MRLIRVWRLMPAVLASLVVAGACKHDDPTTIISRDGATTIPAIDLQPAAAGFLTGTRAANRFLYAGFDTSVFNAFGTATSDPPHFIADPNGFYGTTKVLYGAGAAVATYAPLQRLLPALVGTALSYDPYGFPYAITYIIPGGHPGNGAGNTSWEFWYVLRDLTAGQRYIFGLVRYALDQRGLLDWTELLQTGAVTQPDSLIFAPGDFIPGGNKANDNGFIVDCTNPAEGRPVAGVNPFFIAGRNATTTASRRVIIDHTICSDATTVWTNGFGSAKSPVPPNNRPPLASRNEYNFLVVWEALADSTPDYTKPVYREQIGPLMTTTGTLVNNSFGPIPTAALTQTQLVLKPGGIGAADSVKVTANSLVPLSAGGYQVYVVRSGTDTAALVTGRAIRLNGATVVDTQQNVSSFNMTSGTNSARFEFSLGTYYTATVPYDQVVLAVAPASGTTTLPGSQPLWGSVKKDAGAAVALSAAMSFGSFFNGRATKRLFGASGLGAGGLFGLELREDVKRLAQPPVGYLYQGWLLHSSSGATLNLGTILTPYPDLTSFPGADTSSTSPYVKNGEITQSAIRMLADSIGFYCQRVGTTKDFARVYDLLQIRLAPKNMTAGTVPPTLILSGKLNVPARTVNDSTKACS